MSTADYTVIHLPEGGPQPGTKSSDGGGDGQVGYISLSLFRPLSLVWRLCSYLKRRTDAFNDAALEAALPIGTGTGISAWQ